ncbi:hypothetical protein FDECE_384 [Fusarium decemcellulare]|nr:hypothetical protein FDECE_384 [Fusarium decemcellulare]
MLAKNPDPSAMDPREANKLVADYVESKPPSNLLSLRQSVEPEPTPEYPKEASIPSSQVHDYGLSNVPDDNPCTPTVSNDPQLMSFIGTGQNYSPESTNNPAELEDDDLESLADCLRNAMQQHVLDGTKEFLPLGELRRICTFPNVLQELEGLFPEKAKEYAHYVCRETFDDFRLGHSAHKLFVILALTEKLDKLPRFIEAGICDRHLPFTWEPGNKVLRSRGRRLVGTHAVGKPCFLENEKNFMRVFYREQWQVLIPFISKTKSNQVGEYELGGDTIMPWIFYEPVGNDSEFSQVFKIMIHPDHHTFDDNEFFALKVLKAGTKQEDFEQELYALRKTPSGSHVIDLFATFKVGDELSFLFPWAKGGSLTDLMKQEPLELFAPMTGSSKTFIRWIAEQCIGLAKGLYDIHNAEPPLQDRGRFVANPKAWKDDYGIHGDVKTDNILRFVKGGNPQELGELKWSDFGLTKFHTKASRSMQPGNGPLSPTYASPEHNFYSHGVSRRSDIWALGCVFTELLTWVIRGRACLEQYSQDRLNEQDLGRRRGSWREDRFFGKEFALGGTPGIPSRLFVKNSVLKCIEENKKAIAGAGQAANCLTDFLDFIRDRMLVIEGNERAESSEVCSFLKKNLRSYNENGHSITLPSLSGSPSRFAFSDTTSCTMGWFDCYCSFCSGPFHDAYERWTILLEKWTYPDNWPDGFPLFEDDYRDSSPYITISEKDGEFWDSCVCVTHESPETFVSPECYVGPDTDGVFRISSWGRELDLREDDFIPIHKRCLSFICRHNGITPRELWESFYGDSSKGICGPDSDGLITCVDYYHMEKRNDQEFAYALTDRKTGLYSPESMEECNWLLARPTLLPALQPLQPSTIEMASTGVRKVFGVPELLNAILGYVADVPTEVMEEELKQGQDDFDAPSAIIAAKALLALTQVDRWFYHEIVTKRQSLFLESARNFGWMLPFTREDWSDSKWANGWSKNSGPKSHIDWRAHMLTCLNKNTPHVRNRWRFHMMAVQFARGTSRFRNEKRPDWYWNAGKLGFKPNMDPPNPRMGTLRR